jgi:hypothetical protein
MSDTTYRVIPQKEHLFSVEMTRPSGHRRLIPDFRDKAEADAWIIQTTRLLHELDPRDKVIARKPSGSASMTVEVSVSADDENEDAPEARRDAAHVP